MFIIISIQMVLYIFKRILSKGTGDITEYERRENYEEKTVIYFRCPITNYYGF
ncbi:hypothetical protein EMIT079MI2_90175 [Bacillus sp. IT-79MI2]